MSRMFSTVLADSLPTVKPRDRLRLCQVKA